MLNRKLNKKELIRIVCKASGLPKKTVERMRTGKLLHLAKEVT